MTRDVGAPLAGHVDMPPLRLVMRGISKSFGETQALDALDLDLVAGEVLGIAGPNGAGKSTLVRLIAGEETRDAGEIRVADQPWEPSEAQDQVAVVHQEPQLWPNLTLAENLMVGREPGRLSRPVLNKADRAILIELEIEQYADVALSDCSLAIRQRTEIARALARDARFFLFDEPNSALTEEESDRLFRSMRDLAMRGRFVVLVTHRLAELVEHCQRVAVIRDGRVRIELEGSDLTQDRVAQELVVGHVVGDAGEDRPAAPPGPHGTPDTVTVSSWTHAGGAFRDVTLEIQRGEIVALVGVEGSGARELAASIAGFADARGTLTFGTFDDPTSQRATAYLSADRRGMLFQNLSVGQNLVIRLGRPDIAGPGGFLLLDRLSQLAARLVDRFQVRTPSTDTQLTALSGGNQQKVAIAAAIACRPQLLVLEEPTRGVDVGSKSEIYRMLRSFAAEGHSVVAYCTEVPEVYELADRVAIVDGGRMAKPVVVADMGSLTGLAAVIARGEHTEVVESSTASPRDLLPDQSISPEGGAS